MAVNFLGNAYFPQAEKAVPLLGLALCAAIIITSPLRSPEWAVLRSGLNCAIFLAALVALASLMPVERLPNPSPTTIFGLGLLSAVFDNIPLTALALRQGGYDWAMLAYAVGFGGSMMWFGSSAGVALTTDFPDARSVVKWLRYGWPVALGYFAGFAAMLAVQ